MEWVDCSVCLPVEKEEGQGSCSRAVEVILSDGTQSVDWLINGKWVVHCKKNGGPYPVKWRDRA
jgi:hypothetical protein